MQTLKFAVPVGVRNEVFSTVRVGKKWKERVKRGCREVEMQTLAGASLGTAEVTAIWFGPLHQIPAIFLESEHDPIARTWSGLHACLQNVYDKSIPPETEVTALRLRYTGPLVKLATVADIPKTGPKSFGGRG